MDTLLEQTELEVNNAQAVIKALSKSKKPVDIAQVKRLKEILAAKQQLVTSLTKQKQAADKGKSEEVKAAESAHAKAMAEAEAEGKARREGLDKQKQDNIDMKRESQERVNRKLDKEEAARKKLAEKKAKEYAKELKRPLTRNERIEMDKLERQSCQGKNQPDAFSMQKLGRYRIRAKIGV